MADIIRRHIAFQPEHNNNANNLAHCRDMVCTVCVHARTAIGSRFVTTISLEIRWTHWYIWKSFTTPCAVYQVFLCRHRHRHRFTLQSFFAERFFFISFYIHLCIEVSMCRNVPNVLQQHIGERTVLDLCCGRTICNCMPNK